MRTPSRTAAPLADASRIASYRPPAELLDHSRFAKANRLCSSTSRFVLAWSEVRPFDRLQLLRGRRAVLADLQRGTKEIRGLLASLHEFACKELEAVGGHRGRRRRLPRRLGFPRRPAGLRRSVARSVPALVPRLLQDIAGQGQVRLLPLRGDVSDIFGDLVKLDIDAIHANCD